MGLSVEGTYDHFVRIGKSNFLWPWFCSIMFPLQGSIVIVEAAKMSCLPASPETRQSQSSIKLELEHCPNQEVLTA